MDQRKIGEFIARLRKEQGLTQKQLAEKLELTDKAISKWECGYSMPDNGIMISLCDILGISVNELLSGEKLSSTDYNKKAEENIMNLIQECNESKTSQTKKMFITMAIEAVLIVLLIIVINISVANGIQMSYFLDFVSLTLEAVFILIMLIAAKKLKSLGNVFKNLVNGSKSEKELVEAKETVDFTIKASFLSSGIVAIIYFVNMMRNIVELSMLGPNLAVIVLSVFYALIISTILIIIKARLK